MQEIITSLDVWNHRSPVRQKDGMMRRFSIWCRPLELVFSNGIDKGVRIGPATGNVEDMTTFEQFYDAYKSRWIMRPSFWDNADNAIVWRMQNDVRFRFYLPWWMTV